MKFRFLSLCPLWLCGAFIFSSCVSAQEQHFAEGVKVGEVTDHSAIVWVRVSRDAGRRAGPETPGQRSGGLAPVLPAGTDASKLPGAVPGFSGRVRLRYGTAENLGNCREVQISQLQTFNV